jgi:5-methyltetrahydrofolate--homocysteine methyltransferase
LAIVEERLKKGEDPLAILDDARKAMEIIGQRFEESKVFIPELVYSGEILKQITERVKPKLTHTGEMKHLGKVIVGTIAGDIHDIGKNVVCFMLETNGFEVHDLGVDVPAERFVEEIKETQADIVGMSGFLTFAYDRMKETTEAIKAAGLRDKVKIMIGGTQMDDRIRDYTGADAYGPDAMAAVRLAKGWLDQK